MKGKKHIICVVIVLIILIVLGCIFIKYEEGKEREAAIVIKSNNLKKYEKIIGKPLKEYIQKEDKYLSVEDITKNKLNDGYIDGKLIVENYYSKSGLLSLINEEEILFGMSYSIPTICLNGDGNLLFGKENGEYWTIEEEAVCIEISFDILKSPAVSEREEAIVEMGLWQNGNFITITDRIDRNGHYVNKIWAFKDDKIYPRIKNLTDEAYIITNGIINITRDDAMKRAE